MTSFKLLYLVLEVSIEEEVFLSLNLGNSINMKAGSRIKIELNKFNKSPYTKVQET